MPLGTVPLGKAGIIFGVALALPAGLLAGRMLVAANAPEPQPVGALNLQPQADSQPAGALWPVFVSLPEGPPRIPTGQIDELGRPVTVSCASCHANLAPNAARRSADDPPMQFHQGLVFHHAQMSCVSCHNPQNYNTLRLADATPVAYPDVMTMCAQCHAPQARDWTHGAHGGMTGYWDRTRGPRQRKSCIDCHDPHAPAFPTMTPTFKPRDRFLNPAHRGGDHD